MIWGGSTPDMLKIYYKTKPQAYFVIMSMLKKNKSYDTDTWDAPPKKIEAKTVPNDI